MTHSPQTRCTVTVNGAVFSSALFNDERVAGGVASLIRGLMPSRKAGKHGPAKNVVVSTSEEKV